MSRKTKKLTCIITGRVLVATNEYYEKKMTACGSEEELQKSYICKEAKKLLLKGYDVDTTRSMLNITEELPAVDDYIISNLTTNTNKYLKTSTTYTTASSIINARTDPSLEELLNNLRNE
tara:strand:+ start:142 stop:501 length:360 start_codon:yes stop_codon:yes gene_type:complete